MTRYSSAFVIAMLSALLGACGPSPERKLLPHEEPMPKIGLLMDTLSRRNDGSATVICSWSAPRKWAPTFWSRPPNATMRSSCSRPSRCSSVACRCWWSSLTARKPQRKIVEAAKKRSVPVISYDRLILKADVDLYMSYDNRDVGEQQAQFLRNRAPKGNYILLGGAPTDHNAKLIREGQMAALEDGVKRGEIKIVADPWTPDWKADAAMALTEAALKKAGNQVVAVVASNDVTAGGAIAALEKHGLAGKVLVSGQDANLDAVRRIVQGTQTMTVYKPLKPLALEAASAAVRMAKGEKVEGTSTIDNGMKQVQARLLTPITIHKDLVPILISDNFHTKDQIYATGAAK